MLPFDDADPRELVGEGWDSDADWGYGGPEPCCSPPLAPLDGGLTSRTSSSSSVGSDPGPFIVMRPLDDADPRELAREGWDSDRIGIAGVLKPAVRLPLFLGSRHRGNQE